MKLSELMQSKIPNPAYAGQVTNDDNVLAVDLSPTQNGDVKDYVVVQTGVIGVDSNMNPVTTDSQYIRTGLVTTKTGQQRTFGLSGDRFFGDEFQDYVFDPKVKYGVGEAVKVKYVYFCLLNGKGEEGTVAIIVNSDGSGNAGENAGIDVAMNAAGAPKEYDYTTGGGVSLIPIAVTSVAGTNAGDTKITATPALPVGHTAFYQTSVNVTLPAANDVITGAPWLAYTDGSDITATTGDEIGIIYVDSANQCKYAGKTIVTSL